MAGHGIVQRHWGLALLSGGLFVLAGFPFHSIILQSSELTTRWPGNALILGLLLVHSRIRAQAGAILGGMLIGAGMLLIQRGIAPITGALLTGCNLLEVLLALSIIRRMGGVGHFERISEVTTLGLACLVAPIPSSIVAAVGLHLLEGEPLLDAAARWYAATALNLCLLTPVVLVVIRAIERPHDVQRPRASLREAALVLGMTLAASVALFAQDRLPLLFAVLPFVLLATFRLRQLGAVASVVIVASVAMVATSHGHGPIAVVPVGPGGQQLFLQFFLAVIFVSALPVAAAMAESDASAAEAHLLADHFKSVVENINEVIFRTDAEGRLAYLNPAWERLSGHPVERSLGRTLLDCVDARERDELAAWTAPVLSGEVRETRRLIRFGTAGGAVRWTELSIQAVRGTDGAPAGATGTLRDVDDRKRLEEQVMDAKRRAEQRAREATVLASTDELTSLANRRAFLRHIDRQIDSANEFGWDLAVAIFDVDYFKAVNDAHGHAVGDRVLQRVAARAVAVVRSGDLVGRLGGEEFGILMPGASREDAAIVAERLRQAIEADRQGEEAEELPRVTVSVGLASRGDGDTSAALLAAADLALYAAKDAGRNRITIAA